MRIFTLGHSNHDWPTFQRLLDQHRIGCIADVRSRPRSRLTHFSAPYVRVNLNRSGVAYLYLGDLLGGIPVSGPDRYEDMARTVGFRTGIDRLLEIAPRTRLALLCAEHDPLTCHRFLLITRHLATIGVAVDHILRDGSVESQQTVEGRLLVRTKVKPDLLTSPADRLALAYAKQEQRLGGAA